ncbi:hypothetical protein CANARDRAFT_6932 [[Candida] arabinofermentans NRRL YB-2248]|uniref:Sugar phosphate phosphatase n=1 Tax=[Candida] arabinofermentans NRRL YB-2248 TaxID=983967 RepID=A0A1E4T414_9ASCO|nr:hypothetical protein CANARDRAFT_6932 [[Candida] arabinofermentans NRRL YB-2248]
MTKEVPPLYYNNDTHSFGFSTARSRWPNILATAVKDTELEYSQSKNQDKIDQGKVIAESIKALSKEITENCELTQFKNSSIPSLDSYDETLASMGGCTWLTGPWLFCECYMYRRVDALFKSSSEWLNFDVFNRLKRETFKSSSAGIYELAVRYKQLKEQINAAETLDTETLKLLFEEFVDVSLWGNATDLSLLANASLDSIKSLQGKEARAKSAENILCNDLPLAWDRLLSVPFEERRVDFVLDNAGFEFYTDLILALFMLDAKLTKKVVFHCKTRPWMVSDTMIKDYDIFVQDMLDTSILNEHHAELQHLVESVESYKAKGQFELQDSEFWTGDLDYWNLNSEETKYGGKELWLYFQDSALVIVKGDLNYRKLTGDRHWPRDTPFVTALNKLASSGIHILALRTCKADVCAGLPTGKDEELCELWKSQGNEIGELWCSSGKWAVISYSDGSK